jgi:cation-transporting P-type ATPase E
VGGVTQQVMSEPLTGLTATEAEERRRRGETNHTPRHGSRTYGKILRTNVFSFFNVVLFVIGAALLSLGRTNDALVSVGTGLVNALISAVQEIRAKRKLDRLQLLDQEPVTVLRDGRHRRVPPDQVVRDDVVVVGPKDQIAVDGPLLDGVVEIDESLLTGESDPVVKHPGDLLRSGSFCVAGTGHMRAVDLGLASYAGRLTREARRDTTDTTPLQRHIAFLVRLVIALTVLMSGAILGQALLEGMSLLRVVQITAVLSGLVPYGLFLLIAVAYTAGAVRLSRRGALVQQLNAVEALSTVDVICTDKTGTLTTGQLAVHEILPVAAFDATGCARLLGSLARSATTPNLTTAALLTLEGKAFSVREEVPFASSLRWSGVTGDEGTWVLGAPDVLTATLVTTLPPEPIATATAKGLRVLLLARAIDEGVSLRDRDGRAALPRLEPVALLVLADELRPEVAGTIARCAGDGVEIKVLSGDDPRTVAALARQAGLPAETPVAGADLDVLDDAALDALTARTSVFGRVAPEHKERVVASLRRQGRHVAMIGDGVNDARAIKGAHVGVAMRSGSAVTRDVADIVLVDDSFAALLPARTEGRRIISGIGISLYVFLARVAAQGTVILAVTMLGLGFPYSPTQVGLTMLTVGVPTMFLTLWARPARPDPRMLSNLARFVIPAGLLTAAFGTAIYAYLYEQVLNGFTSHTMPAEVMQGFQSYTGLTYTDADFATASATIGAQTGLQTFFCLASFALILVLAPPSRHFAFWTEPVGDRRPLWLVAGLTAVFFAVLFTSALSDYFGLTGPGPIVFTTVLPALVLWFAALAAALRLRLLDRLLGRP